MADRFLIAPYDRDSGLQSNVKAWLISDRAFSKLNNAYVWRGRVRKRFGSRWITNDQLGTRLRESIGVTIGGDNFSTNIDPALTIPPIGLMFSIGPNTYTVNVLGTPATLLINGTATTATYNTNTGDLTINGSGQAIGTTVYMYPGLPVMGLLTYDSATSVNEPTIAFDTRFSYQYVGSGWERLANENAAGDSVWSGSDSQLFYGVTWVGDNGSDKILIVTNFNESEPNSMRYLDNSIWNTYRPLITSTEHLFSARIMTIFHNHVIALNTWEGTDINIDNINFQNRARWSWTDSPTNNAPDAWRQDIPGRGSGLDAATTEAIIGCEFIQDRMIVYFERSTWELVFTGNSVQPFTWQRINTELGAESTFSVVPFDKMALGIASVGIHSCNGIGVDRIDTAVPELIDDISNDHAGAARVYGIRDYTAEMVYWAYPDVSTTDSNPFPNKILLYNYVNNTWATSDDVLTCFGYFQAKTGVTWDSTIILWDDDISWNSGGNANIFRTIVAGNQQGFTYIIDQDMTTNAPSLQITDITSVDNIITLTVINNCYQGNDYIFIENVTGTGTMSALNENIFQVLQVTQDTVQISYDPGLTGVYSGYGTIAAVSQIDIISKQYNFYIDKGRNSCVNKIDFQVKRTDFGQISIQMRTSSSTINLTAGAASTGALVGTGVLVTSPYALYPYEATAERVVHPFYTSVSGSFVQMTLTLSPDQMMNVNVMRADFQLHSMTIYATPTSRLQ